MNSGQILLRLVAVTAIALGFLFLGLLGYKHIYLENGGTVVLLWPAVAGLLILWGAGVLDFKSASPVLHDLASTVPVVGGALRGLIGVVLPGGNRKTDPPVVPSTVEIAERQAELPQSGTAAAPHQFDPGA